MRHPLLARLSLSVLVAALGVASPLAAQESVQYIHTDAIGNVRAITDANGTVIERHDYLPFGEECTTGPCAANPGVGAGLSRKFTGKERDPETGLDYFGARYYSSKVGRFTTIDPVYTWQENLVDPQRWNRYAYARNNPLRYVDPDGRAIETPWDALNVGLGVASFTANVAAGNVGGAVVDALGIAYDATATAVPVLPGGAGTAIRAARAADKAADVVRGGVAPVLKGKEGVEASIAAARARGETILGTEITVETAVARTRIDLATRTREGQLKFIECKNGPCAGLTPNQKAAFPEIGAQGGVPRGRRAAEAGLKPGERLPPTRVEIERHNK